MAGKSNNFTNKDLLIRIDERQKNINQEISEIKKNIVGIRNCLNGKVSKADSDKLVIEVKKNTSWRTYVTGAVGITGAIIGIFVDDLKSKLFR